MDLLSTSPIAQTKQVNDIARLDNRQSNFTPRFSLPLTANNVKAMEYVYCVGNQSNVPYQHNKAMLYDAESGDCLIYNGWAVVNQTTSKGYECIIYDGIIDLYKKIENLTLTQIGINDLDHIKSVANIIASWADTLPYKYIIADYNGKNTYNDVGGNLISINSDYQIPSARISYLWNRVMTFAGFTYTGSVFQTDEFLNLFMTYPNPVPSLVPHEILINAQHCTPIGYIVHYYSGVAYLYRTEYLISIFRNNFTSAYAEITTVGQTFVNAYGDVIPVSRYIHILQNGIYSISVDTTFADIAYYMYDGTNTLIESGLLALNISTQKASHVFNAQVGYKIYVNNSVANASNADFNFTFNQVDGYQASFSNALVDFKATDFVNEIMQRFGLTMFKDKYSNNLVFKTIDELLASNNILDWSHKFSDEINEKYMFGNYAQVNNFKYRYDDDNYKFNDGFIKIENVNLPDSVDILTSKIYSPSTGSSIIGMNTRTYKLWNKEVKDNGTIEYKDLKGRYYLLRSKSFQSINPIKIGSEVLNISNVVQDFPIEDYSRLTFNEIIEDNYASIESILNKSKLLLTNFYLKSTDISKFDFQSLIYVEQKSSYYLVNKINNFIKGKLTQCEIIEVDYKKQIPFVNLYLNITGIAIQGCQVTITVDTNIPQPFSCYIVPYTLQFGSDMLTHWLELPLTSPIIALVNGNTLSFTADMLPPALLSSGYNFLLHYLSPVTFESIDSALSSVITIPDSCYLNPPPQICTPSSIVITNVQQFHANYPAGQTDGSYWHLDIQLNGITNENGIFTTCLPYTARIDITISSVTQTINIPASYMWSGGFGFNLAGYPSHASFKVTFINPTGTEYVSNTYNF
ncbi:hypothetical protein OX284_014565 [Flavobacterium sp. SUN046]|uniref:hypothetical protein n=1 Tax=Flavobacterium sp. SUN046 TaxID=3002440 RepID=UPI002DBBE93D|nr:hypothetical protein [Flavobacterium sp. SUN046]MEC4050659.1 hypothetical protein [Flavobacterium sp. SUN046]